MITDVHLACSAAPWGKNGFVEAVEAVSAVGYDGIECPAFLVNQYEDRLHVFEEIFQTSQLKLVTMLQIADFQNPETADEEVERAANTARFLSANGAPYLIVSAKNEYGEEPPVEDDWTTFAAILEEMGVRCAEFGIALAFRPKAGLIGGTDKEIKKLMAMTDKDIVGLCFDTAELTLAKIPHDRFYKTYASRILHVRFRDVSSGKNRPERTSNLPGSSPQFGRGGIDIAKVGKIIENNGYSGFITVDVTGESRKPGDAIDDAFRHVMKKSGLFV
ncbi:MAG: sugar phosphate isomerase/epimerase family protein [Planctomycetota bacterium]|jgi:inosose dehydratase